MAIVYFYDLPVYRLNEKAYYKARAANVAADIAHALRGLPSSTEVERRFTDSIEQHDYDKFGPWLFAASLSRQSSAWRVF